MEKELDYSKYTLDELHDAASHINREKYGERARRIDDEIARRTRSVIADTPVEEKHENKDVIPESNENAPKGKWNNDRIIKITNKLKIVFLVLTFIFIAGFIRDVANLLRGDGTNLWSLLETSIFFFIYIGLRMRKKWLTPLVLIISALGLLNMSLYILTPAQDELSVLRKVFGMMLAIFFAYLIYFFSRREVKTYFGAKESIFF
jgi:hypothetical protein